MASKLLNIRMDEGMLQELKKVCGELGINVTDAIKSFSKDLIENKKLPNENKENDNEGGSRIVKASEDEFLKVAEELREVCYDKEGYEKMQEEISDIILTCNKDLRKFIEENMSKYSFEDLGKNFKEIYSKEFNDKILDIIIDFYITRYKKEIEDLILEQEEYQKFEQEKYIVVMEKLEKKDPQLYKELLDEYTLKLSNVDADYLKTNGYLETEKKLKEILNPEEIEEFIKYRYSTGGFTDDELESFNVVELEYIDNVEKDRKEVLMTSINKVRERLKKEKLEKEQKEKVEEEIEK